MKRLLTMLAAALAMLVLAGCGDTAASTSAESSAAGQETKSEAVSPATGKAGSKILVAYFSRTGENYQVGNISKGNTHIMAEMIAEETGADLFEIKTVKPYPDEYKAATEVAKEELEADARPKLTGRVNNIEDYDVIFLGYPIWWSDMPMAVYTFLESYDFNGKTIIPFCTSAGDVLTGKESDIPRHAKGAKLGEGLGLEGKRVQERPESARPEVHDWLTRLGYAK